MDGGGEGEGAVSKERERGFSFVFFLYNPKTLFSTWAFTPFVNMLLPIQFQGYETSLGIVGGERVSERA